MIDKIKELKIKSRTANKKELEAIDLELEKLSIDERILKYGFKPDRADVIVPAATIFMHIMEHLNIDKLYVPKVGLGDGMIHEMYEKVISKKQSKKK